MSSLEYVSIQCGSSSCTIAKFGATVTSWKCNNVERLWMSTLSPLDGSGPIRGGIPIAFPQFADQGSLKLHGFAREQIWTLVSQTQDARSSTATFTLQDNDTTRAVWNYSFVLQYSVTVSPTSLSATLTVRNTSQSAFLFTGCLHTYLRTPDIRNVALNGLKGVSYIDKVAARAVRRDDTELLIPAASVQSGGYVDRIYISPPQELEFRDASTVYHIRQSESFSDTVIFNPWETGKYGPQHPDFDDDGFNYMLCVEPAIASKEFVLNPGMCWEGSQNVEINV